jgi:hypothetical protein
MNYECELPNGQHLELDNDGDETFVSFSNRGEGQQQSQGNGFTTGEWSKKPTVYRVGRDVIVQLDTADGFRFLRVQRNRANLVESEPSLENAEQIELKESTARRMKPMEPMRPMKPMEPMRPMEPMKPMRPLD